MNELIREQQEMVTEVEWAASGISRMISAENLEKQRRELEQEQSLAMIENMLVVTKICVCCMDTVIRSGVAVILYSWRRKAKLCKKHFDESVTCQLFLSFLSKKSFK